MSRVRSDKFTNRAATGPCTFTHGMHSTDTAGTGIGVSLGYGGIVAVGATISGNLSVGGTITYEDTTNVDSTGIVTARNGIKVGQPTGVGATFNPAGDGLLPPIAYPLDGEEACSPIHPPFVFVASSATSLASFVADI